ncbi:ABC transporter ATP-binding protein [Ktedonobacteria bacterium brp13]|nr:ABC transporter ATP-binding protein [Ktedonobacteria bacterium brp13]
MPDIRIQNVTFTYAGSAGPVLRSINLTIPEGEFVLLAGPSGCGKSTLALAVAGLIPSRITGRLRGSVYLGEQNVSKMEIQQSSQQIGMVFQSPEEQLIHLDVDAEVAFGPENLSLPRAEIEQRVASSLAYTGMEQFRKQEIYALSGGQKQRIAIAATLAMQPKVLVLDEPTSDLDPLGTQEVLSVLRRLNKEYGMTIVLVEHKIDEIIPWVDRVLLMDEGSIVVDAPPRKAFDDIQRWQTLGVSIPQMVQLAQALPDIFQGEMPLSVEEAYSALQGSHYEQILLQHATMQQAEPDITSLPGTQESLLSWNKVHLAYGAKQVLKDINVTVSAGEWVAIIGPNGSGKTSLATLAMGFQAPTSGTLEYKGLKVRAGRVSYQSRHIAYLFQAADMMLFSPTVEQELLFGSKQSKARKQQTEQIVEKILETIDLGTYRTTNPFNLSFGQRKRLAIGALLVRRPELLLLDEPTTGQDEGHARAFLQFLQQLREREHMTYTMITHDMRAVALYASRVLVLNDGHIVMDGPPATVFAHPDVLAASSIIPPPIAQLHARLCQGNANRVALHVDEFLRLLQPVEVRS